MAFQQWVAGARITAARLAGITPKFTSWTPEWTATGGSTPSYGNATLNCQWAQTGDLVFAYFDVTFGSTTSFGDSGGNWRFALPVESGMTGSPILGFFECNFESTATRTLCKARQSLTTTFALEVSAGQPDGSAVTASGELDHATPETWTSGDTLKGQLIYQAA